MGTLPNSVGCLFVANLMIDFLICSGFVYARSGVFSVCFYLFSRSCVAGHSIVMVCVVVSGGFCIIGLR